MSPTRTAPQIRASHLKTLLAALPALGDAAPRVRDRAATAVTRIERAGRLHWLSATVMVDLCEAARAEAGEAALEPWGAATLRGTTRAPLAHAFFEAAALLGGRRPGALVTYVVQAWRLLYIGCGTLELVESTAESARLVHAPVPELLRRPATLLPLVGALGAIPGLYGIPGHATAEWSPDSPRFTYTIVWRGAA